MTNTQETVTQTVLSYLNVDGKQIVKRLPGVISAADRAKAEAAGAARGCSMVQWREVNIEVKPLPPVNAMRRMYAQAHAADNAARGLCARCGTTCYGDCSHG